MAPTNKRLISHKLCCWRDLCDPRHYAAGAVWYAEAHDFAYRLACKSNLTLLQTAGVISVLSPGVAWGINQRQAETLCFAHAEGLPLDAVTLSTYTSQWWKAYSLLKSPPASREALLDRIGGVKALKTKAFACNLLSPDGPEVTVDRWITRAAGYDVDHQPHPALYRAIADAIRSLADGPPTHLQAAIWLCAKDHADSSTDLPF